MILVFGPQSADYEIQLLRRDRRYRCRWSSLRVIGLLGKDLGNRVANPGDWADDASMSIPPVMPELA